MVQFFFGEFEDLLKDESDDEDEDKDESKKSTSKSDIDDLNFDDLDLGSE